MWCFRKRAAAFALGWIGATGLSAAPVSFSAGELPWAAVGTDYSATIPIQVDGACPRSDVALSLAAGSLPRGVRLHGATLSGAASELGLFRFRLRAANVCGVAEEDFQLVVTGRPVLRVSAEEVRLETWTGGPAPGPETLLVSGTWPGLPYSITNSATWLRLRAREGRTPAADSALTGDAITLQVLPQDLASGVYETTLFVGAHQALAVAAIRVQLTVRPAISALPPGIGVAGP